VRFYQWLYYRCYRYSERGYGPSDLQWVTASFYMLGILLMNLLALYFLLLTASPVFRILASAPPWTVGVAMTVVAALHMAFLHQNGRYKKIVKRFSNVGPDEERRSATAFGWYFVISLSSLFVIFIVALARIGPSS
jgi:uncharacterized membrane protein